jgi:BioD-like phosphotransacetylase family protein
MSVLIVASSQPRAGRSLIAAALAYRFMRDGKPVTLARLSGDDSADADAKTFATLEYINSPGRPLGGDDLEALAAAGNVIVEAPPGSVKALAEKHKARVIAVGSAVSRDVDAPTGALVGAIVTCVAAADLAAVRQRAGLLAALAEDRALAAPSVGDIAAALKARWLVDNGAHGSIERVMIGTVSSDAASPYFEARERKCVVTRFDKTDIQLAALQTDMEVLVLTGGGQPSPYLLDRVAGTRDGVSVLLAEEDTVGVMRAIEGLYGGSRFEGAGKLERAVALLDEASVAVEV